MSTFDKAIQEIKKGHHYTIVHKYALEYAQDKGSKAVWRAYRVGMTAQSRPIKPELQEWPIPEEDQELDTIIAELVVRDFLEWAQAKGKFGLADKASARKPNCSCGKTPCACPF